MRVVGGKWRGRRLSNISNKPVGLDLRPTMDRVRETIFNILENGLNFDVREKRVLDLFCGTGALGFEALSRGAEHVCFIDKEKTSLNLVSENSRILKVNKEVTILKRDVTKLTWNSNDHYDLIFLDPPYGKSLGEIALGLAIERNWISKKAIIIWEERNEVIPPRELNLISSRTIGNTGLYFLKRCH